MDIEDIDVFIGTQRRYARALGHEPGRAGRSSTRPCTTMRSACVLSTRSWPREPAGGGRPSRLHQGPGSAEAQVMGITVD